MIKKQLQHSPPHNILCPLALRVIANIKTCSQWISAAQVIKARRVKRILISVFVPVCHYVSPHLLPIVLAQNSPADVYLRPHVMGLNSHVVPMALCPCACPGKSGVSALAGGKQKIHFVTPALFLVVHKAVQIVHVLHVLVDQGILGHNVNTPVLLQLG